VVVEPWIRRLRAEELMQGETQGQQRLVGVCSHFGSRL
jgi:hypothetical protein